MVRPKEHWLAVLVLVSVFVGNIHRALYHHVPYPVVLERIRYVVQDRPARVAHPVFLAYEVEFAVCVEREPQPDSLSVFLSRVRYHVVSGKVDLIKDVRAQIHLRPVRNPFNSAYAFLDEIKRYSSVSLLLYQLVEIVHVLEVRLHVPLDEKVPVNLVDFPRMHQFHKLDYVVNILVFRNLVFAVALPEPLWPPRAGVYGEVVHVRQAVKHPCKRLQCVVVFYQPPEVRFRDFRILARLERLLYRVSEVYERLQVHVLWIFLRHNRKKSFL